MLNIHSKTPALINKRENLLVKAIDLARDGDLDTEDMAKLEALAKSDHRFTDKEQLFLNSLEQQPATFVSEVAKLSQSNFNPSEFVWQLDVEESQVIPERLQAKAKKAWNEVQEIDPVTGKTTPIKDSCESMTNRLHKKLLGRDVFKSVRYLQPTPVTAELKGKLFEPNLMSQLVADNKLKPGMIIFINTDPDMALTPEQAQATGARSLAASDRHWFTYLGVDEIKGPLFADPFGKQRTLEQMDTLFGKPVASPDFRLGDYINRFHGNVIASEPELATCLAQIKHKTDASGMTKMLAKVNELIALHPENQDKLEAFVKSISQYNVRKIHSIFDPYAGQREQLLYGKS